MYNFCKMFRGNRNIHEIASIAERHRLSLLVPATAFIGNSDEDHAKDLFMYTDPSTLKIVVKRKSINPYNIHKFLDGPMSEKLMFSESSPLKKAPYGDFFPIPKYVLKIMAKNSESAHV